MDVQRIEQDLNDQLQLCHDQLEAAKVRHCIRIKTVVCVCVHACMRVCDFIKMAVWRLRGLWKTQQIWTNFVNIKHFLLTKVLRTQHYVPNEQGEVKKYCVCRTNLVHITLRFCINPLAPNDHCAVRYYATPGCQMTSTLVTYGRL